MATPAATHVNPSHSNLVTFANTPQIVYKVAICPRGNLPYIQITSIVLPYSQSAYYLLGTYLSWRKSTLYPAF